MVSHDDADGPTDTKKRFQSGIIGASRSERHTSELAGGMSVIYWMFYMVLLLCVSALLGGGGRGVEGGGGIQTCY